MTNPPTKRQTEQAKALARAVEREHAHRAAFDNQYEPRAPWKRGK